MRSIVIIGNGIAGITAAINIRRLSNDKITVISNESHFHYSRPALMYIYMGDLKFEHTKPFEDWYWQKQNITLVFDEVVSINNQKKSIFLSKQGELPFNVVVIATGSRPNSLHCEGENLDGVQGFYSLQDLELLEKNVHKNSKVVIVGGGLIAIEVAEMLRSRNIHFEMLVREESYWANGVPKEESELIKAHIASKKIIVHYNTSIKKIVDNGHGNVGAVITDKGNDIVCDVVVKAIGVSPKIDIVQGTDIKANKGIVVNEYLETSCSNIYAIGDCAEISSADTTSFISPIWYAARDQGEIVASTICGKRKIYKAPLWFNSAKFFEIEHHMYGNPFIGDTLYYASPDAHRSLRINYVNGKVTGFCTMGIRYNHEVCENWINTSADIENVLSILEDANFDPEFSNNIEERIRDLYYKNTGKKINALRNQKPMINKIVKSLNGIFR